MDSIGIGALAKRAGVRIDTVRYYEKNGLLAPRARLASGIAAKASSKSRACDSFAVPRRWVSR